LFRSKAVWGYDAGFMALMPAALAVSPKEIAAGDVWIATGIDGQIAGSSRPRPVRCRHAGFEQAVHRAAPYPHTDYP
jgi:hypothetical protein